MAFADQHGLVLAAGNVLAVHTVSHTQHHFLHLGAHRHVVIWQGLSKHHPLVAAPFVEMPRMHPGYARVLKLVC